MRGCDPYSQPPSDQMQLWGLGEEGEADMEAARQWRRENPMGYSYLLEKARQEARRSDRVSMRDMLGWLRLEHHIGMPNALTPAMARMMEAEEKGLAGVFSKARSRCDGWR